MPISTDVYFIEGTKSKGVWRKEGIAALIIKLDMTCK